MIKKIATTAVYVSDQAAAEKFWTETMGFEVKASKEMGHGSRWLEVAPMGAESALVLYPKKLMKEWEEHKPMIVFWCDDIVDFCKNLKERGVTFKQELNPMPWGRSAIICDPDGNEFVLKG